MAYSQPLRDVATIIAETGVRPLEVYELRRHQINLEKGFLQIENGKTKAANRKIWFKKRVEKILRVRLENSKATFCFRRMKLTAKLARST